MLDDAVLVAEIRATLAQVITSDALTISQVYDEIERAVPELVAEAVEGRIVQIASRARLPYIAAPDLTFVISRIPHQVHVAPHATAFSTLVVTVGAISSGDSTLVRKAARAEIESIGRYGSVHLYTSRALHEYQAELLDAAGVALRAAYGSLLEYTARKLKQIRSDTASVLYGVLRRNIPVELVNNIWLYAFAEGQGFYIPDAQARDVATGRLQRRRLSTSRSPGALLTDFISHVLPLEKTFSRDAIKDGKPVEGLFATAPYAEEGVGITEQGVYDAEGLRTMPVARVNDAIVVAGYPISVAAEVQDPISRIAPELQAALEKQAASLHQQLHDLLTVNRSAEAKPSSWWDALELKPNFFGVGVNFNALISRSVNARRRRRYLRP